MENQIYRKKVQGHQRQKDRNVVDNNIEYIMLQDTQVQPSIDLKQDVVPLLPVDGHHNKDTHFIRFFRKILGRLPYPVQRIFSIMLTHAQDPEPEEDAQNDISHIWNWFSVLTLVNAFGLLSLAYSFSLSRQGEEGLNFFFFLGLSLIFLPTIMRLLSTNVSRLERIGILCVVGISCYLVKVIASPLYFSFYDEFLHWRTADDIFVTGHLFSNNMMLPVSPYYPGLEIVTNAFSMLSGLNTFQAGVVVIGVARLLMILAIFLLNEQILHSSRAASISLIIYMSNPHFLLFDAQYGYESLALPLSIFVIFIMSPYQVISVRLMNLKTLFPMLLLGRANRKELRDDMRLITVSAWATIFAVAIVHHVTTFFLIGILLCWTFTYAYMRLTPIWQSRITKTVLFSILITIGSIIRPGNPVVQYLSSFFAIAFGELGHIVSGSGGSRQLFVTYTGQPTPVWERVTTISSVLIILCSFPFGLLCLQQRYRSNALTTTFAIIAFGYPLSQVFRFTNSGAELTDRAAAFLFLPISIVIAIFIVQFFPTRTLNWYRSLLISLAMSFVCLGGIVLGSGPSSALLPGPYQVIADARSVEVEGIQDASWTRTYLGPGNRVATDRANQILMGTYGYQSVITSIQDKVDVSPIFLPAHLNNYALSILRTTKTHYLVVDLRLSTSLPLLGYYYEESEDGAFHRATPVSIASLTKFDSIPGINRVFDSGDILIYDVGELVNAQ